MRRSSLQHSLPGEPFHQRHRGLLVVGGLVAIIFVATIAKPSNDTGGESGPR
jgi:hypothetical protein